MVRTHPPGVGRVTIKCNCNDVVVYTHSDIVECSADAVLRTTLTVRDVGNHKRGSVGRGAADLEIALVIIVVVVNVRHEADNVTADPNRTIGTKVRLELPGERVAWLGANVRVGGNVLEKHGRDSHGCVLF